MKFTHKHLVLGALAPCALLASCAASSAPKPGAQAETSPVAQAANPKMDPKIQLVAADAATPPARPKPAVLSTAQFVDYQGAIKKTAAMTNDARAQQMAQKLGLDILNLTWEDSGRYKDSSVGPNISDMTIQVAARNPKTEKLDITAMPVIRQPNFSDVTADIDPHEFTLIGRQSGGARFETRLAGRFFECADRLYDAPLEMERRREKIERAARLEGLGFGAGVFSADSKKGRGRF